MKNKGTWNLIGILLFILGITSLVMQLVGVRWAFLAFFEMAGGLVAFIAKIVMVMAGVLILVWSNTDWERDRQESSNDPERDN